MHNERNAVDPSSHGPEVRSGLGATSTSYTYDDPAQVVQVVHIAVPTPEVTPGTQQDLVLAARSPVAANGGSRLGRAAAEACGLKSFSGDTLVLMADGTERPIDQIKVGDQVVATDPETDETAAKTVLAVWVHDDTLTDLKLEDGTLLATTEDHPFWSVDDQRFERTDQLSSGERVLGADGSLVAVDGLDPNTARIGLAYNLTVDGIHTYHVGDDAILVHNTGGCHEWLDPRNYVDPKDFAGTVIKSVSQIGRGAATETGRHGAGYLARARALREIVRTRGYVPEVNFYLLQTAKRYEMRSRGINHPGGW